MRVGLVRKVALGAVALVAVGVVLLAGTSVGGYLGAHIAISSGEVWVRRLFAVVVVASAARLLLA